MEVSKKYIAMCRSKRIQSLCRWDAGDHFFIKSQEVLSFLEKSLDDEEDGRCMVWVENYNEKFEMPKKDLVWIPTLSQLVLTLKEHSVIKKLSLNFSEGKWTFNACCIPVISSKTIPVLTVGESAHEACLKALITIIRCSERKK